MAFVQGFLAELTLDTNIITLVTADVSLDESKTSLDKSVMDGTGVSQSIPGKVSGTLTINGHIDQANLNLLEVSWAKDTVVPFILTINEGLGTDGTWTGNVTLTSFTRDTAADGNWAFSLSGDTSGVTVFTPSVP
jgi:hypothetical protein